MSELPPQFDSEHDAEEWLNANYRHKWTDGHSAGPIYANEHNEGIEIVHADTRLGALNRLIDQVHAAMIAGRL